ncbi:uncharacterized protein LOC130676356 [Microplitis mediator]|uniref:uncharacterized protein LOC130676356 n=1 Tax=Microplitis mediator TaxID=375433 RepID=UPI0025541F1B|nr:uncharacterized protein LOC130676356 [Microplitis mediator]
MRKINNEYVDMATWFWFKEKQAAEIPDQETGLSLDEAFNCDESPLNYKILPSTTLTAACEAGTFCIKGKKERVTVMACSNASRTLKLPLVLIEWFEEEFVPAVSKFLAEKGLKKALLFVDNCAAHPSLTERKLMTDTLFRLPQEPYEWVN